MADDVNDVAKALAAFGGPAIRYHTFGQSAVRASTSRRLPIPMPEPVAAAGQEAAPAAWPEIIPDPPATAPDTAVPWMAQAFGSGPQVPRADDGRAPLRPSAPALIPLAIAALPAQPMPARLSPPMPRPAPQAARQPAPAPDYAEWGKYPEPGQAASAGTALGWTPVAAKAAEPVSTAVAVPSANGTAVPAQGTPSSVAAAAMSLAEMFRFLADVPVRGPTAPHLRAMFR